MRYIFTLSFPLQTHSFWAYYNRRAVLNLISRCFQWEIRLYIVLVIAVDVRLDYTAAFVARDYDVVFSLVSPKTKPILFVRLKYCLTYFPSPCSISGPSQRVVRALLCGASCRDTVGFANRKFEARIEKQLYSPFDFLKPPSSRTSAHKLLFTIHNIIIRVRYCGMGKTDKLVTIV